jgi:hypothetical protein
MVDCHGKAFQRHSTKPFARSRECGGVVSFLLERNSLFRILMDSIAVCRWHQQEHWMADLDPHRPS